MNFTASSPIAIKNSNSNLSSDLSSSAPTTIYEANGGEHIQLSVLFNKKNYTLELPESCTLLELKNEIMQKTDVPPKLQKITYKGKILKEDTKRLSDYKVRNKSKLLCIGNTLETVISATTGTATTTSSSSSSTTSSSSATKTTNITSGGWSEMKEHQKIIQKGVPEKAVKGLTDQHEPLPKSIPNCYDRRGELIRLTFRSDLQELWIASKESTQKLSYFQIRDVEHEPIHTHPEYQILSLQIGPNSIGGNKIWIYFVPAQFTKAIKYTILGGGSSGFPFVSSSI